MSVARQALSFRIFPKTSSFEFEQEALGLTLKNILVIASSSSHFAICFPIGFVSYYRVPSSVVKTANPLFVNGMHRLQDIAILKRWIIFKMIGKLRKALTDRYVMSYIWQSVQIGTRVVK